MCARVCESKGGLLLFRRDDYCGKVSLLLHEQRIKTGLISNCCCCTRARIYIYICGVCAVFFFAIIIESRRYYLSEDFGIEGLEENCRKILRERNTKFFWILRVSNYNKSRMENEKEENWESWKINYLQPWWWKAFSRRDSYLKIHRRKKQR